MDESLRRELSQEIEGKVIESMEWEQDEKYWVITFTDGPEIHVRLIHFSADLLPSQLDDPTIARGQRNRPPRRFLPVSAGTVVPAAALPQARNGEPGPYSKPNKSS
jgi:hypothetical protein